MLHYNTTTGYNKVRYNADGTEIQKSDGITVTDSTITKESRKTPSELVILVESITKSQNKSVTETIRLDDWTRFRKDEPNRWSD